MLGCRSRPAGWRGQGGTPRVPALLRGRGSPCGKHLYNLVKRWEAQTASVVGDQGITDLQHFQRRFETRLDWRWGIKLGCAGLRLSPGVGNAEQPPGCPGHGLRLPEVPSDAGQMRAGGAGPCAGAAASPLTPRTPQHPCAAGEGRAVLDEEIRAKASRATSGLVATDVHTSGSM